MLNNIEVIKKLVAACESLLSEMSREKAADWGLINDALVAARKALAKAEEATDLLQEIADKIEGWGHAQCSADLVAAAKRLRKGE